MAIIGDNGKGKGQTSRRKFLKDAGLLVGGATVGSIGLISACNKGADQPAVIANNATTNSTNAVIENAPSTTSPPVLKAADTSSPPAAVDLELFNPAGNQEVTQFFAPRINTLEGKTIAFLASDPVKWQPHRIFPVIMEELIKLYPTIKFLPMDQFSMGTTISNDATVQTVANRKPDAVIIGSAG